MAAFMSEGVTDDMARDMSYVDLKALGLSTMSQAQQFKSHVAEFLSGATIEKPHAAAASGMAGGGGAAVPSAPPIDDDHNDVVAPHALAAACMPSAPPAVHPSLSFSPSNIPTEFTDQFNPHPAYHAPLPRRCLRRTCPCRYFTLELLLDPVVAADGFTCAPSPPPRPRC